MYMAHRAVIFATAQLSCFTCDRALTVAVVGTILAVLASAIWGRVRRSTDISEHGRVYQRLVVSADRTRPEFDRGQVQM